MSIVDKNKDKKPANQMQSLFLDLLKELMTFGDKTLALDPTEIVAIVGVGLGDYAGCNDDIMMHDPDYVRRMNEACVRMGRDKTIHPCLDTAMANVKFAYEDHIVQHKKIRDGMEVGSELLKGVCESHNRRK